MEPERAKIGYVSATLNRPETFGPISLILGGTGVNRVGVGVPLHALVSVHEIRQYPPVATQARPQPRSTSVTTCSAARSWSRPFRRARPRTARTCTSKSA